MTDNANAEDDSADDHDDADSDLDGAEITPEQFENMRRSLARMESTLTAKISPPEFSLPESTIKNLVNIADLINIQLDRLSDVLPSLVNSNMRVHEHVASIINTEAVRNIAAAQANFDGITEFLTREIDLSGIAASIAETFAWQQSALFKNLGPAIAAMQGGFYPPNLRSITDLDFNAVNEVVMTDGIALYGLPRAATAEALLRAESSRERRDILGRRWKTISADCRGVVLGCTSEAVAQYVPFAQAALDALDAGHAAAAQALAGSLIDAIVTNYFGSDRYRYTPNKKTSTSVAYDEFTVREFVAFAPMWQAYQQFNVGNGDKIPATFSRNATAHTVSRRQFNRRNALQGLMFVCSLLYRIDEESSTSASRK